MLGSERTRYIISQLHSKGIINLKDIAKELNISEATVRRDFEKLENEGRLTRSISWAACAGATEPSDKRTHIGQAIKEDFISGFRKGLPPAMIGVSLSSSRFFGDEVFQYGAG